MLAERIDSWNEQLRQQARQEGRQEAEAETLLLLLETRFGQVDQATRDRIVAADTQHLTEWIKRFATAASPSNVAASPADIFG